MSQALPTYLCVRRSSKHCVDRPFIDGIFESLCEVAPVGKASRARANGNVTAQIFWLKTRARWRETPVELRHSGSIGSKELDDYSDEELIAIIQTELSVLATKTITSDAKEPPGSPAPAGRTPRLVYPVG